MENVKVRNLVHSPVNIAARKLDSPDIVVDGKILTNPNIAKQSAIFTRDILRGAEILATVGTVGGKNNPALNWIVGSVFIVEALGKHFAVLSGSHRLAWLEMVIATFTSAITKATGEEQKRLTTLRESWLEFEVSCDVRRPRNDGERLAIIAEGNGDAPDSASTIKQSYASRFLAMYDFAPIPTYLFTLDAVKKDRNELPVIHAVDGRSEEWTSTEYRNATKIGNNNHTTYSSLTRLGKHFQLEKSFFADGQRLTIKPEISAALLIKGSVKGEGSERVAHLGLGLETRYKRARAECKPSKLALDACRDQFKAEFLAVMDVDNAGARALGNTPPLTSDEEKAEVKVKAAEKAEAQVQKETRVAENMSYVFERDAVKRAFGHPDAPSISPEHGHCFDLLLSLNADRLTPALVALLEAKSDGTKAPAALAAIVTCLGKKK